MCKTKGIKYTCGCKHECEFTQCQARRGTNVRCEVIVKGPDKMSIHPCPKHLIDADSTTPNKPTEAAVKGRQ